LEQPAAATPAPEGQDYYGADTAIDVLLRIGNTV